METFGSKHFEDTGERFIPHSAPTLDAKINLERYMYAVPYCKDKKVLELGCGSGLGTYLYSLVATHVTAIDYSDDAIEYAKQYPFNPSKVEFRKMDLEKEVPQGSYDVTVATEFLEHISDPASLIAAIDTKFLVFSLPLKSLATSVWHKYPIRDGMEGIQDVRDLIEKRYVIEKIEVQNSGTVCHWVFGYARKRKSWI